MAGHSKWANTVHRKTRQDAKKSKIFAKMSRLITLAARDGGGNPDMNPRLRLIMDKARAAEMPADNIQNAIKRGTGEIEGVSYESAIYEGHGPGGISLMIEVLTDNKTRTVSDLRRILKVDGGSMSEAGSVTWMFEQKGVIAIPREKADYDELFMAAVDAGAEDVIEDDEMLEVRTEPRAFQDVYDALQALGLEFERAEVTMIPTVSKEVSDEDAPKVLKLLDDINDNDDVQQVFSNFEISDEVLERIEA
ncbi:MAG: YebC/PmpR family DNA-binding transcriptional regulator [Armatimonadetes bacterium]|nr:YebC/PmpR family DNA-binding transcriptional regulator [Armatimonadota bacterium]